MELDELKDAGIEYLMKTPAGETLNKALLEFEKCQTALCALINNEDTSVTSTLRVGTVFVLAVVNKMIKGKEPNSFSKEDWKDIADTAIQYGIIIDGDKYSSFVFDLYAKYLTLSVEINKERIDDACAKEVYTLINELNILSKQFEDGDIYEPDYVEKCLWICLEALVKLMAAYKTSLISGEYASLIRAISDYAVSFARYKMYQKERALIEEYIQNQYVLDEKLNEKYEAFYADLQKETEHFNLLIDNAFNPDFRNMLRSSADLALASGVRKEEVLDSIEKIDDFFM